MAFAAWHLFLEGGCQEGANLGIAQCVCRVLARGLFTPWKGSPGPDLVEEVRAGLVLSSPETPPLQPPSPPGESQEGPRRARTSSLRAVCWGLAGRVTGARKRDEGCSRKLERKRVKPLAFVKG